MPVAMNPVSMNSIQERFQEITANIGLIVGVLSKGDTLQPALPAAPAQPTRGDGLVYMTSVKNRARGTYAGMTIPTTIKWGAIMLTDETHQLATDEEIVAFQDKQEEHRKLIQKMEYEREHGPGSYDRYLREQARSDKRDTLMDRQLLGKESV